MRRYLAYSGGVHAAMAAFLMLQLGRAVKPKSYTISFIGGPQVTGVAGTVGQGGVPAAKKEPAAKAAPGKPARKDTGDRRKNTELPVPDKNAKDSPLSAPSILNELDAPVLKDAAPKKEAAAETLGDGDGAGVEAGAVPGPGGPGLSVDFPDFPYPWYITRVRQRLWERWLERRPGGNIAAVVVFELHRDGSMKNLGIEESSGSEAFDYAAVDAAREAGPFAPLPPAYKDPFLRVHVEFRSL